MCSKKIWVVIFKKQMFSFNVGVISNTSVYFFVNISITLRYWKYMFSESVLNSSYVYDEIETSEEVLAGFKMMLPFLSRATSSPSLTFFG